MNMMFILALILKNNSIVDIFWGPGFLLIAAFLSYPFADLKATEIILFSVISLWALRLSMHIFFRNIAKTEDFRYANWRKTWKYFVLRSYFQIFMLQGSLLLLVATPIIATFSSNLSQFSFFTIAGTLVFLFGFIFESVADFQLSNFVKQASNKGKLIRTGLWKYSRHPNYFGEALLWWGIWIISIPGTAWYFTIISPILMSLLLRYVSGVPMLEARMSKYPEWKDYALQTPVFVPWLKK